MDRVMLLVLIAAGLLGCGSASDDPAQIVLIVAGLTACGSASDDPAQANVIEKQARP